MDEIEEKYRHMIARGVCAHAAITACMSFAVMQAKEEGCTLQEGLTRAREVLNRLQSFWAEDQVRRMDG